MDRKQRRSIRLPDYDYSQLGAYFVTICVQGKEERLGDVAGGEMRLNVLGQLAADGWDWLSIQFPLVSVPVWCVMPNHAHAIIVISESDLGRGGLQTAPTRKPTKKKPLGRIVGAYKTHTTVQINQIEDSPGTRFWQRNYYERVIRNQRELEAVHDYILTNPLTWDHDEYRRAG